MALIKNEIPILEYDTEKKAIIMPGHGWDYKFTKKAVMLFMEEEIDNYVSSHDCEVVGEFESITKKFPVYKIVHNGEKIVFCQAPLGGAAATHIMDQLIGGGAREIIATGCCGSLIDDTEGDFFIPTAALRQTVSAFYTNGTKTDVSNGRGPAKKQNRFLISSCAGFWLSIGTGLYTSSTV